MSYTRINFKDYPDTDTPLNASNLNKLDKGIYDLDQEVGTNDISSIGDGTLKGAIAALQTSFSNALTSLKATDIAQFVGATGSTFASVISALTSVLQTKSVTATTSAQTVSPDSGKVLSSVTVNPQSHSGTRASVTANGTIDLGATHDIRYVPVSVSAPTPSASTQSIASTGTVTISCSVGDLVIIQNAIVSGATLLASFTGQSSSYNGLYRCTSTTLTITNMYAYKFGLILIHFD